MGEWSHLRLWTADGLQAGAWDWQLLTIAELPAGRGIGASQVLSSVLAVVCRAKLFLGC